MTVFESGTYMTVRELRQALKSFPDEAVVCGTPDGRMPLVAIIPSYDEHDAITAAVLHLGSLQDHVEI